MTVNTVLSLEEIEIAIHAHIDAISDTNEQALPSACKQYTKWVATKFVNFLKNAEETAEYRANLDERFEYLYEDTGRLWDHVKANS